MREAARRIVEISAMDMFGSTGSMELHTGIRDGTQNGFMDMLMTRSDFYSSIGYEQYDP